MMQPPITGNYQVMPTDFLIPVGTITAPVVVTLPASPIIGSTYVIKDANGIAATYNITVSGNGFNIDGYPTYVMKVNYETLEVTYDGAWWVIR